ncbi:multisubstrate pseudouridine synthase 7 [Nowakowskiella sp. JEL0407]|nr:multisubstrate pseudouridine synthase 7 [Nowakowskiella sp. JEL0407]
MRPAVSLVSSAVAAVRARPVYFTEFALGLQEFRVYPSVLSGFKASFKDRFEDFHVHEVDVEGNVVRLTNLELPSGETVPEETPKDLSTGIQKLAELLSDETTVNRIARLIETQDPDDEVLTQKVLDKQLRTTVHKTIKEFFGDKLESKTENDCLSVRYIPKTNKRKRRDNRDADLETSRYCTFHLYKENKDTMEAIGIISKLLKTNPNNFTFAGTKDKRAITVQQVTGMRIRANRICALNKQLRGMKVGNFRYVDSPLCLGLLSGNRFSIVLREVEAPSESTITNALASLKDNGFLNYYGQQRFGTRSVSTHQVGQTILAEKYEEAVDLILRPKEEERQDFLMARTHWKNHRNPTEALNLFPRSCTAERAIMSEFVKSGENYVAGLNAVFCLRLKDHDKTLNSHIQIPRNLKLMYVHAYQSFVWNHMVSQRLRLYGPNVVLGDLVYENPVPELELVELETPETPHETVLKTISTEEDLKRYTLKDVVLPLPGHSVQYPDNEMKQLYKTFLEEHGGLDINNMKRQNRDWSLPGSYRKIVAVPKDCTWSFIRYNDPNTPLIMTDFEIAEGKPPVESIPDGKYLAVILELTLLSSQYATMALREVFKKSEADDGDSGKNEEESEKVEEETDLAHKERKKTTES